MHESICPHVCLLRKWSLRLWWRPEPPWVLEEGSPAQPLQDKAARTVPGATAPWSLEGPRPGCFPRNPFTMISCSEEVSHPDLQREKPLSAPRTPPSAPRGA